MNYAMTPNELSQALNRIRTLAAKTDDPISRGLVPLLLGLAMTPGIRRPVLFNATAAQSARLDWALER